MLFVVTDTTTTDIYTLSLHDALPICPPGRTGNSSASTASPSEMLGTRPSARSRIGWTRLIEPGYARTSLDRKSTRLNSSHLGISYAVFCLKKKKNKKRQKARAHRLNV